jgi:Holliday junction resolvase
MPYNRKGSRRERELLEKMTGEGFIVHRIAGSGHGETAICDLIAVKEGKVFFVESKSSKNIYYPSKHSDQLQELVRVAKLAKAKPILAVKLNYKDWQMFDISKKIPEKIV